ncbi:MAG: hypothetical protein AABY53_01480 [Bdellovibrionota bacterium]
MCNQRNSTSISRLKYMGLFFAILIFSNFAQAKLWDDEKCVEELISLDIPAFPYKAVGKVLVNNNDINDIQIVTETGTYNIKLGVAKGTTSDFDYSQHVINGLKSAKILFQNKDADKKARLDSLLDTCMMAESQRIREAATVMATKILKKAQKDQKKQEEEEPTGPIDGNLE